MNRKINKISLILSIVIGFLILAGGVSGTSSITLTVNTSYNSNTTGYGNTNFSTIQTAINKATAGDTIIVDAGTYPETLNLEGKTITLEGTNESTVIINASSTTYAISNFGDSTTIENLTLIGTKGTIYSYGFKVANVSQVKFANIKIVDSYKTGMDLNGVNDSTLTNIEVLKSTKGFGIDTVDSNNITFNNITTSGNAWGGVSVETSGQYYTGGSIGIKFVGFFNASESTPLLLEEDQYNGLYYNITNIQLPTKFKYIMYGFVEKKKYKQEYYQETLPEAEILADEFVPYVTYMQDIAISDVAKKNYYVIPTLSIQSAIDRASSGDVIHVASGTYKSININKGITLEANKSSDAIIKGTAGYIVTISADNVTVNHFTITGGSIGIISYKSSNSVISDNVIQNNSVGLYELFSNNNTLSSNNLSDNQYGIVLLNSGKNVLINNIVFDNQHGIKIMVSNNNTLINNNMFDNKYNFNVIGTDISNFIQVIDTSNTVNGKPIYYLVGVSNQTIGKSTNAGYVGVVNSTNIKVHDIIVRNNAEGVLFVNTKNSSITDVRALNNQYGIILLKANNDTIFTNIVQNNTYGIGLKYSSNNTLGSNSVFNNTYGIFLENSSSYNILMGNILWDNTNRIFMDSISNATTIFKKYATLKTYLDISMNASNKNNQTNISVGGIFINLQTNQPVIGKINIVVSNRNPVGISALKVAKYIEIIPSSNINGNINSVYLRVNYTNAEVKGLNQNTLRLYWWNTSDSKWIRLTHNAGVNTKDKFVYANLTHFSIYGISGSAPVVISNNGGGGSSVYIPTVTLLANNIDLGLATNLVSYLKAQGIRVQLVNATDYKQYRSTNNVIILGGQNAYNGVGGIVSKMLNNTERNTILQGIDYMKQRSNFWAGGEIYIFAGKNRIDTQQAWEEHYKEVAKEIKNNWD